MTPGACRWRGICTSRQPGWRTVAVGGSWERTCRPTTRGSSPREWAPPPAAAGPPAALDRLVRACLAKDPTERLQSAHDLEVELKWIRDRLSVAGAPLADHGHRPSVERLAWWTAIGALVLAVGMIIAYTLRPARHMPEPMLRAVIKLPEHFELSPGGASITFSPDGQRLAVVGSKGDERPRLWLRAAEGAEWKPLAGTEGASYPFWSPDGGSIAFFANHMLERIDLSSGMVLTICAAPGGRGGTPGDPDAPRSGRPLR